MSQIKLSENFIKDRVKLALTEDLYPHGDVTTSLLVNDKIITAKLISNQNAVVGGLRFTKNTFNQVDKKVKLDDLKHPERDEDRVQKEEWLVMLGICTHLGCVPLSNKGEYNGWFCPCHGSHYDTSGRIRKGPAPTNMEVPKYEFVNSNTIKIG